MDCNLPCLSKCWFTHTQNNFPFPPKPWQCLQWHKRRRGKGWWCFVFCQREKNNHEVPRFEWSGFLYHGCGRWRPARGLHAEMTLGQFFLETFLRKSRCTKPLESSPSGARNDIPRSSHTNSNRDLSALGLEKTEGYCVTKHLTRMNHYT